MSKWKLYTIKKGKHTSYCLDFLLIRAKVFFYSWVLKRTLQVWVKFPKEAFYKDQGDTDLRGDWNKMIGINLNALAPSNKNSVNLGWKADTVNGWFYVTHYYNIDGENIKGDETGDERVYNFAVDEEFYYRIEIYRIFDNKTLVDMGIWKKIGGGWVPRSIARRFDSKSMVMRMIAPWFGGADNDDNQLGGVAPVDVSIWLKFEWLKT